MNSILLHAVPNCHFSKELHRTFAEGTDEIQKEKYMVRIAAVMASETENRAAGARSSSSKESKS